jgi:hypothetical protein
MQIHPAIRFDPSRARISGVGKAKKDKEKGGAIGGSRGRTNAVEAGPAIQ